MVPVITKMEVYPVAGHDSMLLNLSGGHAVSYTHLTLPTILLV